MNMRELQAALGLKADGVRGPVTTAAILEAVDEERVSILPRLPPPAPTLHPPAQTWPKQSCVTAFYGPAGGPACTAGRCVLPFPFVIAWDAKARITQFACHVKVADTLTGVFADAAAHYGEKEFRRLRLDRFGGCFNHRPMRGGTALSMHAWGIAVDLDPERNQLRWGNDRASFARPEYEPFWKIVEARGATSLGRARGFDWMHFQFADL